ncbi:MAG: aminotransferase class I/II-fold pyridoxal phosphate-dependent enzyme [Candidatus Omnitrophica bacterium]|nr:aminotransferase class I/II-fold pyridoxal phosphate-dependent enzyme [Candidatus Omnitrophota bacterium]
MDYQISKVVKGLAPSGIRAFFDLVLGMKDVISLGVGEPDFMTPWHVREEAIHSLEKGYTSYTSNKGMPELRKAITQFLQKRYGLNYNFDDEVLITVGVSEGLDLVMRALINPGDKVLIHQPCYVSYAPTVQLAGGTPVLIDTNASTDFKLTPQALEKACVKGCKILMLNYPCNPTGASYSKKELNALAQVIKKKDLIVVSDEVYDELTYDFDHTPLATLPGMRDRVVYMNGFSKAYAMTGFRIAWASGPAEIIAAMTKIHQYTMLCASITGQIAAIEALKHGQKPVQDMKREYNRRRRFVVEGLNELGLTCHMPQGAFYVFPSIQKTGMTSMDFAQNLLQEQKVALVPGIAFGTNAEGFVRISYASSYENLKEALERIAKFVKRDEA